MAFSRFPSLPIEIRVCIWKDALDEEVEGRLFFVHRNSSRIMPTMNNISPLLSVNVEARHVAKSCYNLCLPVLRLPGWKPRELMSCKAWLAYSSKVRWGAGLGSQDQTWINRERYWYHYALTRYGETAEDVLREVKDEWCLPRGCVYFNTTTDRFLLSYEAFAGAMDSIRNIVFADVKDDSYDLGFPEALFGSTLGELWRPEGDPAEFKFTLGELQNTDGEQAGKNEVDEHWNTYFFPAVLKQPRTLLYLELLASRSCTLIGEVEENTAKCLSIIELKIDKPKEDNKPAKADSDEML
ncbi:hypothetical protein PG994_013719 [Apiospora phragmitis]|uniref:2EXR domain-containing protein n=1 Tax=Apiospora phragmitis TaxID=2905665 RepID=A0ABR1TB75_9PEZI